MRRIPVDAARSLSVCLSVCQCVGHTGKFRKTGELIDNMPSEGQTCVGQNQGARWRHLANTIEDSCSAAMRPNYFDYLSNYIYQLLLLNGTDKISDTQNESLRSSILKFSLDNRQIWGKGSRR